MNKNNTFIYFIKLYFNKGNSYLGQYCLYSISNATCFLIVYDVIK